MRSRKRLIMDKVTPMFPKRVLIFCQIRGRFSGSAEFLTTEGWVVSLEIVWCVSVVGIWEDGEEDTEKEEKVGEGI